MFQQALTQMREISIGVALRRYTFIDLHHVHRIPRHGFVGKSAEHNPGRMTSAHSQDEMAASRHCFLTFCSNGLGGRPRRRFGIFENFHSHRCR
jgi:hypothetical protein